MHIVPCKDHHVQICMFRESDLNVHIVGLRGEVVVLTRNFFYPPISFYVGQIHGEFLGRESTNGSTTGFGWMRNLEFLSSMRLANGRPRHGCQVPPVRPSAQRSIRCLSCVVHRTHEGLRRRHISDSCQFYWRSERCHG